MASTRSSKRKQNNPRASEPRASEPRASEPRASEPQTRSVAAPKSASAATLRPAPHPLSKGRGGQISNTESALPISERTWKTLGCAIVLLATIVRFWNLGLVPFHHDEGVNGNFLLGLYRTGDYRYDPSNYHGPTLYYFLLIVARLATFLGGEGAINEATMRLVPVAFGVGTVWLVLCLRRNLGAWATLFAATFVALSPGMVYVSRYLIHEMQFVFFTLAAVVAMLRFKPSGKWFLPPLISLLVVGVLQKFFAVPLTAYFSARGWWPDSLIVLQFAVLALGAMWALSVARAAGSWIWPIVAAASLAMVFGSKETAPISVVVLLVAGAMVWGLSRVSPHLSDWFLNSENEVPNNDTSTDDTSNSPTSNDTVLSNSTSSTRCRGSMLRSISGAIGCALVFVVLSVLFYTSFGHNDRAESIHNFFAAYGVWTQTGQKDQGAPFLTYFWWLFVIETPLLVLGFVGLVWNLIERRQRFALFCGFWAGGLWLAYSLIPYKTPWLMLNFVLPMALVSGWTVQRVAEIAWSSTRSRDSVIALTAPLFGVALLLMSWQSVNLNFFNYDNDAGYEWRTGEWLKKYPYVYVHTTRQINDLMREIDRIAQVTGENEKLPVGIWSDEYWPLPWNFRNYKAVGFVAHVQPPSNEIVIIGKVQQDAEIARVAGNNFIRKAQYTLRPGVELVLWVRRDWADK